MEMEQEQQRRLDKEMVNARKQLVDYKAALDRLYQGITQDKGVSLPTQIKRVADLGATLEDLKIDLVESYMSGPEPGSEEA